MCRWTTAPRFALALHLGVWLLFALAPAVPLRAQEATFSTSDEVATIEQLLRQGAEFERARRWGEALGHYESAVKQFPDRSELRQRLTLSRLHFDVARRYADASFVRSVHELTTANAKELYDEVLAKIQTHYVESPNWTELLRRGLASVDVALTEPDFHAQHLQNVSPQQVSAFRALLPGYLQTRTLRTRADLKQAGAELAYQAAQELGIPEPAVILELACGATTALDTYSAFLTADQLEDVFSQIEGNFVGLGVELKTTGNALQVVGVIEGSPAARGGLKAGDRILSVEGQTPEQSSADAIADLLKGPEGSYVSLQVTDAQNNVRDLRLVRQRVDVPSVDRVQLLEGGVGYFRITSFQKTTSRDVDAALWKLHREGMRFLIIDVRGNPGGLLTASVEVADKFVTQGTIVSTRGRSQHEDYDYKAHAVGTWRVPLVVLIDGDSASASEIFAGAIHDHRRGTIVGSQSYGKGSVQGIFPLGVSKVGLRLTTAKFYSPSGQAISQRGVTPDVVVHTAARPDADVLTELKPLETPVDAVLQAGMQIARNQLSQR